MDLSLIFVILIFLFSVVIHEVSHGTMANYLGDPTARMMGRLTLNPLKHLDPIGSVMVPLLLILMRSRIVFGWAKPVPYNPYNLRDQKYGPALVGIAGPGANFLLALSFGLMMRFLPLGEASIFGNFYVIFSYIVWINILLGVFNLIPIPPLDGSKILFAFLPYSWREVRVFLERYGLILLFLFIFLAFQFILPIIFFIYQLIVGQPLLL